MNYAQCEWIFAPHSNEGIRCASQGAYIILYGCLNQHTSEIIFCLQHAEDWESTANASKAYCPQNNCSQYVDLWTRIRLGEVTIQWLTHHHT